MPKFSIPRRMKTLFAACLLFSTSAAFAADLICNGLTTAGYPVESRIALRDGQPEGSLTLRISSNEGSTSLKEESFLTKSTTFDIALTPYKYWIVELNDPQGLKRGVLVARNSLCSARDDMKCEENSELALEWNASFPYRMNCVMR